jgi:hypothetical protein
MSQWLPVMTVTMVKKKNSLSQGTGMNFTVSSTRRARQI